MPRAKTKTDNAAAPVAQPHPQPPPPPMLPAVVDKGGDGGVLGLPPGQPPYWREYPTKALKALYEVMKSIQPVHKGGHNKFHDYAYAKSEDVVGPVRELMVANGLMLLQSETGKRIEGGLLLIEYEFTWVHVDGQALPPIRMTGGCKLVDSKGVSDDKAAPKCHTQAEKYFLIKQLRIRVDGLPDSDADEGVGRQAPRQTPQRPRTERRSTDSAPGLERLQLPLRPAEPLDIPGVKALEDEARAAADMGSEALGAFWRSLTTVQHQNIVNGIRLDLIRRRDAADKRAEVEPDPPAVAAGEEINPDTGEII